MLELTEVLMSLEKYIGQGYFFLHSARLGFFLQVVVIWICAGIIQHTADSQILETFPSLLEMRRFHF